MLHVSFEFRESLWGWQLKWKNEQRRSRVSQFLFLLLFVFFRAKNRSLRKLYRPLSSSYRYTRLDIISSHHTLLIISVRGAFYAIRIGCFGSVIHSNSNSQQALHLSSIALLRNIFVCRYCSFVFNGACVRSLRPFFLLFVNSRSSWKC